MHDIAHLLLKAKSVTLSPTKPYTFASGIKSPIYTDNRLLISLPHERAEIVQAMIGAIKEEGWHPDVIAGVATAGIPWAAWLAQEMKLPMVFVRGAAKDHGKGNQVEGTLPHGSKTLLVEDLVSTGGSTLQAADAIKAAGAKPIGCIAIFTYGMANQAFKDANVPLRTLTDMQKLLPIAVKEGYLYAKEEELVRSWLKDPKGWTP